MKKILTFLIIASLSFGGIAIAQQAFQEFQGGTGETSYATGDILFAPSSNDLDRLSVGSNGQVLKVSSGVPAWGTDNSGSGGIATTSPFTTGDLVQVSDSGTVNSIATSALSFTESQISDLDHFTGADITGSETAFNGWDKDASDDFNDSAYTSGSIPFSNGTTLTEDNTNLFWDDTNNRLGIGTASPDEKLDVNGNIATNGSLVLGSEFSIANPSAISFGYGADNGLGLASSRLALYENTDNNYFYGFGLDNRGGPWGIGFWGGTGGSTPDDTAPHMFLRSGGNVGIGSTAPSEALTVSGNILGTGNLQIGGDAITSFTGTGLDVSAGTLAVTLGDFTTDDLAEGTNLYFTDERAEDAAGGMFSGNTETLITATYQDVDGTVDLVVDNDLSNYSNTTASFLDGVTATGIEKTGTVVALTAGYSIPLTASTTDWQTAYGWGDHSTAGYFDASSDVNHDSTTGFVANEHIDHSGVSVSGGTGLSGGGDITTSRTLNLDINGLTDRSAFTSGDKLAIYEDGVGIRKIDYNDLPGAGGGLTSLNGQTGSTQTFATSTAADTFNISSASDTHTFTIPSNLGFFTNDSGYITDYTVTEADVTQHEGALTITESQISDLSHTTDTNLTQEEVQDFAWNTLTGTQSLINVTYQDATDDVDFVVDDDLSLYDNTTSGFITDYTVTEGDVTQHEAALSITESQISDLNHTTDTNLTDAEVQTAINNDVDHGSTAQHDYYTDADISGTESAFTGWDKDASDDFDGVFSSLTSIPAGLSDGDDDTTYSAGTGLGLSGTTFSADLGTSISTSEVEGASKTGSDATLVTGTAGSSGDCAQWNTDGDLITSGAGCGGGGSINNHTYTGSFVISSSGTTTISGLPFNPNMVEFRASLPVDAESLTGKAGDTASDDTGFAGNMFGYARESDGTQKAMSTGGSGSSINNVRYGASDSKAIYASYGDENASEVAQIEGTVSAWNSDGFSVNIDTYSGLSAGMAGQVVHYTAYRSEDIAGTATDVSNNGTLVASSTGDINFGTNITASDDGDGTVTVSSTDTDTTYTAGTGLNLSGTEFSIASTVLQSGDNISELTNDSGYITGNETITLSGDVTGSGATAITTALSTGSVSDNEINYTGVTLNDFTFDVGSVSKTEFGYLNGVTSAIQTQLSGKADTSGETYSGTHDFSGASLTREERLISTTIASTSPEFVSGGSLPAIMDKDGFTLTEYTCFVEGGTSVVVNLSDGTNDTETITCTTTGASDASVATNNTFTANELGYIEIGTVTGTVNYLHFEAYADVTR